MLRAHQYIWCALLCLQLIRKEGCNKVVKPSCMGEHFLNRRKTMQQYYKKRSIVDYLILIYYVILPVVALAGSLIYELVNSFD